MSRGVPLHTTERLRLLLWHLGSRVVIATKRLLRGPGRCPAQREEPAGEEHKSRPGELTGGRVDGRGVDQRPSPVHVAEVPHQAGPIVDGTAGKAPNAPRAGDRDDQATRLRKRAQTDETDEPADKRHSLSRAPVRMRLAQPTAACRHPVFAGTERGDAGLAA